MNSLKSSSLPLVKSIPLIFLWLSFPFVGSSQSIYEQVGRLPVTSYTPEEYGGYPFVNTVIQGKEGLMYFGTEDGMYEYDGVSWRFLFNIRDFIPVRSLAKDSKGRIFYGGGDFGYLEVDEKGEARAVSLFHLIPEELKSGQTIFEILFLQEFILLRSQNYLIRLELGEDFSLKSLKSWQSETRFGKSFLVGNQIYIRYLDRGLFLLEGEELTLIPGTEIFGKEAVSVMIPYPEKNSNTILLGRMSIGFYFLEKGTLTKFPTEVDPVIQEGNQLYGAISHQGNYILSVLGVGVVIMNPKGEIIKKIGSNQGLPSDVVIGLYVDRNNGLWVTTEDGMARIAIDSPILSFGKDLGINSAVRSIQKMGDELYVGTNTGLIKFDAIEKEFKSTLQIENSEIFGLLGDGDDLIVPGRNLNVIRDGKAIRLDFPQDGSRAVSAIIPKDNPNILLVGTSSGLLLYEKGLSKQFPWEIKGKVPGIGPIGSYFFEGKDGKIFTGGQGKLYVLEIEAKGVESIGNQVIKPTIFDIDPSGSFSMIDGEFYMTFPQGTQKYSPEEGKFEATEDFSVLEKDLYDFTQMKSGILWYESLDKKKYILRRNKEGKFVKDESPNSITPYLSQVDFIDEDSILWFGSPKGLIRYDPKKDNQTDNEFLTLIRRIETKTDTIPLPFYGRNKGLAPVERKDNSYRFEFAAPYFEEEKKTKYQTFLEGFDPDWVDWNDNRFKEYTNLSPGTYTFRVRAMAYTGRISEDAVYSFVVLPPWYATWWAYLIFALLIGGIITAIVKWRSRKLKAENRILEEKVNERTAALERSYHNVELLGEIGRKITSSLSVEKIIATVYANVNALMEASVLGIGIYHEETQTLEFPATYENGEALTPYSNSIQDPNRLSALCFNSGNEIIINDLNEEYGKYLQKMPTPSRGEAPVSLIYLPLKVKGQIIGVITVQSFNKNAFTDYHLYMLRTIAVYTAIALENAESFKELQLTLNSLKETQDQLIHSEKMASLGELTAGIAHEIQNPLNFVNNFSELNTELIEELVEEAEKGNIEEVKAIASDLRKNESKINHHGKRAESIVKGMLQHSRNGSGNKELTDLNLLSDEYLKLAYHGMRAKDKSFNADFETDFDTDLPKVSVVPQDLGRVLLNLINNAFQALNNAELRMRNEGFKPLVTVSTKSLGDKIEISIKDNGPGIPEAIKDKIFQPFFTTKPTGQGTGLGLSLSYDIVKAHGGEIRVASKEGEGTVFTLVLPV